MKCALCCMFKLCAALRVRDLGTLVSESPAVLLAMLGPGKAGDSFHWPSCEACSVLIVRVVGQVGYGLAWVRRPRVHFGTVVVALNWGSTHHCVLHPVDFYLSSGREHSGNAFSKTSHELS